MCRQDPRAQLSAEEQIAAEESLSIYCKPVELYNILQRRAVTNVTFFLVAALSQFFFIITPDQYRKKGNPSTTRRACILTKCTGDDRTNQGLANFILPEIDKLSEEVKSGSLSILFISCGMLLLYFYLVSISVEYIFGIFSCFTALLQLNCLRSMQMGHCFQVHWSFFSLKNCLFDIYLQLIFDP